jgi:hypothetical protein
MGVNVDRAKWPRMKSDADRSGLDCYSRNDRQRVNFAAGPKTAAASFG